jgi:hypothetical protein
MRFVSPPRDELDSLRTPLTPGERRVFDLFDSQLSDDWEIYIQPHLNGLRPDFVLLNPLVGVAVFEVKDWNPDALSYSMESTSGLRPVLWAKSAGRKFRPENPVEQVANYRDEILNLYCPRRGANVGSMGFDAVLTAGVIFAEMETAAATALFRPTCDFLNFGGRFAPYNPIAGRDALDQGDLPRVFPEATRTSSKFMTEELYRDLRNWLIEPDFAATQRQGLNLDDAQQALVKSRTESGYRRIKGPAGSGKSVVLAARAAELSAAGKDVLVVTFNITLMHYLRDLAVRYPVPGRRLNSRITWMYFHQWCKRVCIQAGMSKEYDELWAKHFNEFEQTDEKKENSRQNALEENVPDLVGTALATGQATQYDALLIDEGQDFKLEWWNLLRQSVRPGGEWILVADEAQDLYERAARWTDEAMVGAGFPGGRWSQLQTSYRLPPQLVPHLREFVSRYLPASLPDSPAVFQQELDIDPVKLRWIQAEPSDAVAACVDAVTETPPLADPEIVSFPDVTLLVGSNKFGMECVHGLEDLGIRVNHTFSLSGKEGKRLKLGFWMGDARVKACTIHSFKGWEARAIVVHVSGSDKRSLRALYVGLSRLKRHSEGSLLTVVCSSPQLERYGRTWPSFEVRLPKSDVVHRSCPNGVADA